MSEQINEAIYKLDKTIAILICFNHKDVEQYDWEKFKITCEAVKEIQKNITMAITSGICLSLSSEDQINDFFME